MVWGTATVDRHLLDVWTPASPAESRGVLIFLPGYEGVSPAADFSWTAHLQHNSLTMVVVRAKECCWTPQTETAFDTRYSPLEFVSSGLLPWIGEQFPGQPTAISGVELGGQGALQLAYRKAREFPIVAAISPKVDFETWHGHGLSLDRLYEDAEAARQETAILHLHPLAWPRYQLILCDAEDLYARDGVGTLLSKLASTGIPHEHEVTTTQGGFGWQYAAASAEKVIAFVLTSWADQATRVAEESARGG